MWSGIEKLTEPNGYEMFGVLAFLEHVPDRARAEEAFDRVGPLLLSSGLVTLDPGAEGETFGAARLRAAARLDRPPPVRRGHDRGAPGPPGRRAARRRRLDVQLAVLVPRRRGRLARLPHGRRPARAARQRPRVLPVRSKISHSDPEYPGSRGAPAPDFPDAHQRQRHQGRGQKYGPTDKRQPRAEASRDKQPLAVEEAVHDLAGAAGGAAVVLLEGRRRGVGPA